MLQSFYLLLIYIVASCQPLIDKYSTIWGFFHLLKPCLYSSNGVLQLQSPRPHPHPPTL